MPTDHGKGSNWWGWNLCSVLVVMGLGIGFLGWWFNSEQIANYSLIPLMGAVCVSVIGALKFPNRTSRD